MSPEEITAIVTALGDLVKVLNDADPLDKMKIYKELGLHLTYNLGANVVDVELKTLNGPGFESRSADYVHNSCARGASYPITPRNHRVFSDDLHLAYHAP